MPCLPTLYVWVQEDMCDVPERNEAVKQKQSAAIKMLLELQQQVQHGAGQSVSGDTESAATEPHEHTTWRIWPQVLDYVSVRPHAKQGVVLGTAREGRAFKVRVCDKAAAGDTHTIVLVRHSLSMRLYLLLTGHRWNTVAGFFVAWFVCVG